jgi:hypothetical protein
VDKLAVTSNFDQPTFTTYEPIRSFESLDFSVILISTKKSQYSNKPDVFREAQNSSNFEVEILTFLRINYLRPSPNFDFMGRHPELLMSQPFLIFIYLTYQEFMEPQTLKSLIGKGI